MFWIELYFKIKLLGIFISLGFIALVVLFILKIVVMAEIREWKERKLWREKQKNKK